MVHPNLTKTFLCASGAAALGIGLLNAPGLRVPPQNAAGISGRPKSPTALLRPEPGRLSSSAPVELLRSRTTNAYGKLPLTFEPNLGQVNSQVQFLSRDPGYDLFLTQDEAVLVLKNKSKVKSQKSKAAIDIGHDHHSSIGNRQSAIQKWYCV
jgi:hypothetical protein